MEMKAKKAVVMLADGFEEVEAITVIDILRRAGVRADTVSVIEHRNQIEGAHGITIYTDMELEDIDFKDYDVIILPGGMPGTDNLEACEELCDSIVEFNNENKLLAAICAAPKIFGRLGILNGKKATCFPGYEEDLLGAQVMVENVVVDKNIITSRGMGTAIEFGLKLVEILVGEGEAKQLASTIQYSI